MKKIIFSLLIFLCGFSLFAQQVSTVTVYSNKMKRDIDNTVVLPENYDETKHYPVVYLLHGYGGKHDTWVNKTKKSLPEEATKYDVIMVSPDGSNSWYWDSPVDSNVQFDTYVTKELVAYIDANYSTIKSARGRAITGFSMGGHGGLWLGINYSDIFGACGSLSGGVDIRPFPNNWEMSKWLGKQKDNKEQWEDYTIIKQLHKIEPNTLAIIIDCGIDDFFYQVNEKLHEEMLYMNIQHDYLTRPGAHTHEYWEDGIDYQLLFFHKFFNKNQEK